MIRIKGLAAVVAAVALLFGAHSARAQPVNGLYIAAGAGLNFKNDQTLSGFLCGGGGGVCATAHYGTGFAAVGSLGFGFGNGLRLEGEVSFRENSLDRVTAAGFTGNTRGYNDTTGAMLNMLYDISVGSNTFYPYVGGGVGFGRNQFQGARANSVPGIPLLSASTHDGQTGFAYQAIGGAAFPLSGIQGLSITTEYRYMVIGGGTVSGTACVIDCRLARFHADDQQNHAVLLGLRFAFNGPPAR